MLYNNKKTKNHAVIWGMHPVLAVINKKRRNIFKLSILESKLPLIKNLDIKQDLIQISSQNQLNSLTDNASHQGFVLKCGLLPSCNIQDIIDVNKVGNSTVVILDRITDVHNFGSILRSALAFDIDAVISSSYHSTKDEQALLKSSSGAYEYLNVLYETNLNRSIKFLQNHDYWVIACGVKEKPTDDIKMLADIKNKAILLGNEQLGIRESLINNSDFIFNIDMPGLHKTHNVVDVIDSLNVSNAASIALYALTK